ncbi:MAG TPA: hypothetical protein VFB25_09580 [Gaiellaceae bacterium]|nr:hypothetical protein [Gaiellaceae bacterium]
MAAMLVAPAGQASDLIGENAVQISLEVHGGQALVQFKEDGVQKHVLVWGAINARTPDSGLPQVRFNHNYRYLHSRKFVDQCEPYDGPALAYLITACKAPDGSYWALQSWQRNLPHRGYPPWTAAQKDWDLRISHWTGPLADVQLYTDWAFKGQAHDIFGRMDYDGKPVYGMHTTSNGAPTDSYGRSLYIDTFDSAYGKGWKRETSIVFRKPSGAFCYSFWPTHDVSLPGHPYRPAGNGTKYRISVVGPGVTPDVAVEAADQGAYNPSVEAKQDVLFDQVIAGDKFCSTQH